jgi:uncharacterized protein (DUF1684 family)
LFFLPFSDLTSGKESYIGGKYIDLKIPKEIQLPLILIRPTTILRVQFKVFLSIVPLENDLDIAIEAGVKSFMIK